MANILGSLLVELKANTASFVGDLGKASYVAKTAAKDIERSFGSLGKIASQTFGPFAALNPVISQVSFALSGMGRAAAEAMGSLGKTSTAFGAVASLGAGAAAGMASVAVGAIALAARTAESTAKLYEQAQSAGVTTSALSALSFAAKQNGVDQEALVKGLGFLNKTIFDAASGVPKAAKAFKDLGIDVRDGNKQVRDAGAIFPELMARFAGMANTGAQAVEKVALMRQLMGRGGDALLPMAAGLQKNIDLAHQFGVVISDDVGRKAHEFQQTIGELSAGFAGLQLKLTAGLLQSLQSLADRMRDTPAQFDALIHGVVTLTKDFLNLIDALTFAGRAMSAFWQLTSGWTPFSPTKVKEFSAAIKEAYGDMQKFNTFAAPVFNLQTGFGAGNNALRSMQGVGGGPKLDIDAGEAKASKAEAERERMAEQLTAKYKEQIATFGMTADKIEDWKLKQAGVNAEVIKTIDNYRRVAEIMKATVRPMPKPIGTLDTEANKAKDSQLGPELERQATALDAVMRASELAKPPIENLGVTMDAAAKRAQDLGDFYTATINKLTVATQNFGKTQEQLDRATLKDLGASPEQLASIDAMDSKLATLQASTERVSGSWKKFGDTIASSLADLTDGSKSFSKVLKDLGKQLEEMAIKQALFGNQAGNSFFQGTSKGTSTPGSGGLFGALGGLFQPKAASASSPLSEAIPGRPGATPGLLGGLSGLAKLFQPGSNTSLTPALAGGGFDLSKLPLTGEGGAAGTAGLLKGGIGLFSKLFGDKGEGSSSAATAMSPVGGITALLKGGIGLFSKLFGDGGKQGAQQDNSFNSIFGGALAKGGDVSPGKAYMVGEKHPEFFVPKQAGTVTPSLKTGGSQFHQTTVNYNVHGVSDVDGFRRSQAQISADLQREMSIAHDRNY